ncbi:MAG: 4Fe-4S dicluster domain-containing protein [bacterium]|nr:4Fe-4S dicluster domain-containing protein [bacterium]
MAKCYIEIDSSVCKGCRVCVESCPKDCIVIGSDINKMGYQYAKFEKPGCIGCGICFYVCPEPDAITVHKNGEEDK